MNLRSINGISYFKTLIVAIIYNLKCHVVSISEFSKRENNKSLAEKVTHENFLCYISTEIQSQYNKAKAVNEIHNKIYSTAIF